MRKRSLSYPEGLLPFPTHHLRRLALPGCQITTWLAGWVPQAAASTNHPLVTSTVPRTQCNKAFAASRQVTRTD